MRFISSMPWVTCGQEKGVPAIETYFPEEINFSRLKQSHRFYVFDKSWNFSIKHVIYYFIDFKEPVLNLYTRHWKYGSNMKSIEFVYDRTLKTIA